MCVRSLSSSVNVTERHGGFLPFIPKLITEYSTVYRSVLNFVKIAKQLDQYQYSVTKEFSEFLLIFSFKGKLNFKSLFKCIALTNILKDLEAREVSDRQKSLVCMLKILF